jgi:hypothetical protein
MKQKGPHQEGISSPHNADLLGISLSDRRDQILRNATPTMRARYYPESPVLLAARIEVKPQRKHLVQ